MLVKVFSVYDVKTETYGIPRFVNHIGSMVREFGDAVKDVKTYLCQHPEDYRLYELGEFDDNKGEFVLHKVPKHVCDAVEFVPKVKVE